MTHHLAEAAERPTITNRGARWIRRLCVPIVLFWIAVAALTNVLVPQLEAVGEEQNVGLASPDAPSLQAFERIGEVFHEFDAQGGGAYPTDEAWGQLIYPICDPVFKTYTGTPVEDRTDIDYLFLVPTSDRWAGGDRHVTCFIRSLDGSPLDHSYRASS